MLAPKTNQSYTFHRVRLLYAEILKMIAHFVCSVRTKHLQEGNRENGRKKCNFISTRCDKTSFMSLPPAIVWAAQTNQFVYGNPLSDQHFAFKIEDSITMHLQSHRAFCFAFFCFASVEETRALCSKARTPNATRR